VKHRRLETDAVEAELTSRGIDDRLGAEGDAETGRTLGAAVEHHLSRYFAMHGEQLPPVGLYDRVLREVELPLIALTLSATRGNQVKAAELLGINRNTLRKKIRDLDIPVTRGKKLM